MLRSDDFVTGEERGCRIRPLMHSRTRGFTA